MGSGVFCAVPSRTLEVDPPMGDLPHSLGTREAGLDGQGGQDGAVVERQAQGRQGDGISEEGRSGKKGSPPPECPLKNCRGESIRYCAVARGKVMSGRLPRLPTQDYHRTYADGYMRPCQRPMYSLQVCAVEQYIVMCYAAEHSHVPGLGWARLDWGHWREFGGSSERDKKNKWGPFRCSAGRNTVHRLAAGLGMLMMPMSNIQCAHQPKAREASRGREDDVNSTAG